MKHHMDEELLKDFREKLVMDEKSVATIEKYMRDVRAFYVYLDNDKVISKETVIGYKQVLLSNYAPSSVNSMLAALNCFFKEFRWYECVVKTVKIQQEAFRLEGKELDREEYYILLNAARQKKDKRLFYIMQTLGATGIRISELKFITVEAVHRRRAYVSLKGKIRTVILPNELCRQLTIYIEERHILQGSVFVTRSGKPVDRSNIFHDMRKLSKKTGIPEEKIFPHNLRHLFACIYYKEVKDLPRLADVLGHSNVNTTRIYTRVSCEIQSKEIDMLNMTL